MEAIDLILDAMQQQPPVTAPVRAAFDDAFRMPAVPSPCEIVAAEFAAAAVDAMTNAMARGARQ